MIRKNRPYLIFWLIVSALSILISVASFIIDKSIGYTVYNLFTRSGALIVLSGAALEFQLSSITYLRNVLKTEPFITAQEQDNAHNVSWLSSNLHLYAHALIIIGTLIWSYGDFIYVKF